MAGWKPTNAPAALPAGRKIHTNREHLACLLSLETETLSQAADEVETTIRNFEYYAGWADKVLGSVIPISQQVFDYIVHEPLGVVGHITPGTTR
jgi:aldehyde dehydrogenase (NAD+)